MNESNNQIRPPQKAVGSVSTGSAAFFLSRNKDGFSYHLLWGAVLFIIGSLFYVSSGGLFPPPYLEVGCSSARNGGGGVQLLPGHLLFLKGKRNG